MSKKKMRRRSRMKTMKILRLMDQGRIVTFMILVFCSLILGEPGYLDFDNLPDTNFTCAGKVIGGYYADLETSCQMFHVCTIGQGDEPMDIKFLCLNGTVFDQETRVCERVDEVDCSKSERFYYLNLELYGNTMVPIPEDGDSGESSQIKTPTTTSAPTTTTVITTTRKLYTTPTTTTSSTSTRKPAITFKPYSPSKKFVQPLVTTVYTPTLTPTTRPFFSSTSRNPEPTKHSTIAGDESEEYYEDDYYITEDAQKIPSSSPVPKTTPIKPTYQSQTTQKTIQQGTFSPEQFIFQQNTERNEGTSEGDDYDDTSLKPAISFQQQQFQNGAGLSVSVTSHNGGNSNDGNGNKPKQFSSRPKESLYGFSSSSSHNDYGLYSNSNKLNVQPLTTPQPPKRIQLFSANQQIQPSHSSIPHISTLRLKAHGFRLPNPHHQTQEKTPLNTFFEGYRRQTPQITLHLPYELHRGQKEILGFDDTDDNYPAKERKDAKRSDQSIEAATSTANYTEYKSSIDVPLTITDGGTNKLKNNPNNRNYQTTTSRLDTEQSQHVKPINQTSTYDKVLLTPQDLFIPTLPKIIISASASVSDANGKKLNLSVGNVLATGANIRIPPPSYDEYKEDDVSLDPFFLDVPKIRPRIKRNTHNLGIYNKKLIKKKRKLIEIKPRT